LGEVVENLVPATSHEAGGAGVGVDELGGSLTGVHLHAEVDGRVIEKEDEIMALGLGLGGVGLGGEILDGLLLTVLEDAEVFLGEVVDVGALLVGNDRVDDDQAGFRANDGRGIGGRRLGGGGRLEQGGDEADEPRQQGEPVIPGHNEFPTSDPRSGDLDGAVFGRHHLTFTIAHDEPDDIAAGLDVETGFDGDAGAESLFEIGERFVFQA